MQLHAKLNFSQGNSLGDRILPGYFTVLRNVNLVFVQGKKNVLVAVFRLLAWQRF